MRPSSLSRKRVKDSSLLLAENENKRREESLTLFFSCFRDRKSTRLNSSHSQISYAVFCLKKKKRRLDVPLGRPLGQPHVRRPDAVHVLQRDRPAARLRRSSPRRPFLVRLRSAAGARSPG